MLKDSPSPPRHSHPTLQYPFSDYYQNINNISSSDCFETGKKRVFHDVALPCIEPCHEACLANANSARCCGCTNLCRHCCLPGLFQSSQNTSSAAKSAIRLLTLYCISPHLQASLNSIANHNVWLFSKIIFAATPSSRSWSFPRRIVLHIPSIHLLEKQRLRRWKRVYSRFLRADSGTSSFLCTLCTSRESRMRGVW